MGTHIHRMRILIALIVALGLVSPVPAQERPHTPAVKNFTGNLAVTLTFRGLYPRTMEFLKARFPADYAVLLSHLADLDRQRGDDVLLLAAFRKLGEVRQKYAQRLPQASTGHHAQMLMRLASFYNLVLKQDGAGVCGRFANDGSGVLFELGITDRYAEALDQQALVYFEAVARAIDSPEEARTVAPPDWGVVLGAMVYAGAPEAYVKTIAAGDAKDPTLCPALAAMLMTNAMLQTPESERTRADFAKNLTGY